MFPSSRNTAKLSDFADKTDKSTPEGDEQEVPKGRLFERPNRKSMNEKEGRDNRESWTSARDRRTQGGDDDSKEGGRFSRRDRDQDGERRNGFGDKQEGRWGERRQNGDRTGGWRGRDREKEAVVAEKEPEWMDDPAPAGAEDDLRTMGMPRNQEQFQKWKEAMSGKKAPVEEPEVTPAELAPAKPVETLKLEGITDKPFGGWGEAKPPAGTTESSSTTAKALPGKGKASRFASMFKETQSKDETPPPAENTAQVPANGGVNGNAEDEAGFKRILQMLGGTGIGPPSTAPEGPSSPPARTVSNGNAAKQKSRFTGFFDQTPKSPERVQSPPEEVVKPVSSEGFGRGMGDEAGGLFGGRLPDAHGSEPPLRGQMPASLTSPEPPMNGSRDQQGPPGRTSDIFLDQQQQLPSRGAATPDVNIQNLLASQRAQKQQGQDKNSEFLLNLLQTKGSSRPASNQQQPGRGDGFSLWLDQPPQPPPSMPEQPHAPKPRGAPPPPGFIDDQLLRNAPPDPPRQDQQHQMPERRTSQRAQPPPPPPGFFDEHPLFLQQQSQQQQQRRNFTEPPQQQYVQPGGGPPRRMSGHPQNLPPMHVPPQGQPGLPHQGPFSPNQGPGEFMQSPPPGFPPQHLPRQIPPGFQGFPGGFPQGPPPQRGSEMGGMFAGGAGGVGGGMTSPTAQGGFFPGMPPPGFPMGMRSPPGGAAGANGGGMGGGWDGNGMGQPRR